MSAVNPTDVRAQAGAELGLLHELAQPRRVKLHLCQGGSSGYPVWSQEEQLEKWNVGEETVLDLLGDVTDLVLDGAKFGVVRRPRDDVKSTRTRPRRDRCMDVRGVVGRHIIPDKNTIIISPGDAIHLDVIAYILTKSQKVFADVPMFRTQRIQHRGHSTLPYTFGGRFGSPGSMAKRTVIFWPWP